MDWDDEVVTESTRKPTRQVRASYVPPHLRHNGVSNITISRTFGFSFESPATLDSRFNRSNSSQPGPTGPTRGRGRGRGRGFRRGGGRWGGGRQRDLWDPPQIPTQDPFDISEKFDELEVIEDGGDIGGGINFDAYEDIPVEASGSDIPPPVNSFADIDLGEGLNQNIKRCKYEKPTPIQRHAIPIAIAGRDLMACAQTGSGKTAAFCFPIICRILRDQFSQPVSGRAARVAYPSALILSPTRELSCQIHEEAKKFAYQTGVKIAVAYGGAPIFQQFRNLERGVDIMVATPGRLVDMIERARVSLKMIKYLALDEADRMLDMGFEPQIRKIVEQMDMPPSGARQTMLFSATFPHAIQRLASDFLSNYIFLTVGRVGSSTDLIAQRVELVQDMDKRSHLMNLLCVQSTNGTHGKHALTLVFVETKRGADALENWLSMNGFPAIAIHGDKVQMERERALRSFKSGATPILVATDVASRGLDIPHVAHVINFDLPKDIDDYVHRIGRTGRAGKHGLATAFFSDKNMPLANSLVELMQEANQKVPSWLSQYAEKPSYGGGSGRYGRNGGGRFGGYDFRRNAPSVNESYNYSSTAVDPEPIFDSYTAASESPAYANPDTDYYASASADTSAAFGNDGYNNAASETEYYASKPYEFGYSPGSVIASGWE